ncbi:MAG: hypothetical protein RMJ07_04155 [Nitrososphaerota archaeon]|nr:DNA double-strand break repair nuclease NurA [Candidatus Bathyarchaeota archaeon]MDW8048857.1 hypothetical protein [Nitrososphaerota archaeon]
MIEQLQYDATPKYNFPDQIKETELQAILTELSLSSIDRSKGKTFTSYHPEISEPVCLLHGIDEDFGGRTISASLIPLKPIPDGTPIVGIDASTIRIGETETGTLCAVRAAIVWNNKGKYRYMRVGPFPFYIDQDNYKEILRTLGGRWTFNYNGQSVLIETQKLLCNLIEHHVRASISSTTCNSLILWDGSLSVDPYSQNVEDVDRILRNARKNFNVVIAISKESSLQPILRKITDLLAEYTCPCLFEVEQPYSESCKHTIFLGRVYIAKLSRDGLHFRLDVDHAFSKQDSVSTIERLLGNELNFQGYPETLRLAHIHSTFTSIDVVGIQSYLVKELGIRLMRRPNMRRSLFGPYGTGLGD